MNKNFWQQFAKPIIALAPMDGYSNSAFRRICKQVNPEIIVFTEFTSADGIHHEAQKVMNKFKFDPSEQPVIAQIFGKNPQTFITAAKYCQAAGFSGIDINMGCPSKKVVKSEHGVALRKCHSQAFALVEAVAKNTSLPVSVKTRLGWSNADDLIDFGKGLENAGANLITIHGRTYTVPYSCPADFEPIYKLKRNLKIPVIGNGGITSLADGQAKLGNLDGFMIGQAAFGNPWVFSLEGVPQTFAEKIPLIQRHVQYLAELRGEKTAMFEIRKHLLAYVKGLPQATSFRVRLAQVESISQIQTILQDIAQSETQRTLNQRVAVTLAAS